MNTRTTQPLVPLDALSDQDDQPPREVYVNPTFIVSVDRCMDPRLSSVSMANGAHYAIEATVQDVVDHIHSWTIHYED